MFDFVPSTVVKGRSNRWHNWTRCARPRLHATLASDVAIWDTREIPRKYQRNVLRCRGHIAWNRLAFLCIAIAGCSRPRHAQITASNLSYLVVRETKHSAARAVTMVCYLLGEGKKTKKKKKQWIVQVFTPRLSISQRSQRAR